MSRGNNRLADCETVTGIAIMKQVEHLLTKSQRSILPNCASPIRFTFRSTLLQLEDITLHKSW